MLRSEERDDKIDGASDSCNAVVAGMLDEAGYCRQMSSSASRSREERGSERSSSLLLSDCSLVHSDTLEILTHELDYTQRLISKNFSNYSAYHYRSKLLKPVEYLRLHVPLRAEADGVRKSNIYADHNVTRDYECTLNFFQDELNLVQEAVFTEPSDQSSWWYQRFIMSYCKPTESDVPLSDVLSGGKAPATSASTTSLYLRRYAEMLQSESLALRQLIQEEDATMGSGSTKWALNSLHFILNELDDIVGMNFKEEADEIVKVLMLQDQDKYARYRSLLKDSELKKTILLACYASDAKGGEERDILLELKRTSFKGTKDKSKYVSWFHVAPAGQITRLAFKSWDKEGGIRVFEQGTLTVTDQKAEFVPSALPNDKKRAVGKPLIKLPNDQLDMNVIKRCIFAWD